MSTLSHEPVCFDSAHLKFWWEDHFLGKQIKDEWREAGTGSAAVVDLQAGGVVRITTGSTNLDAYRLDWGDIRSLHVDQKVAMEVRAKLNDLTEVSPSYYLVFDPDNNLGIYYISATSPNWYVKTENGGVRTMLDSGVLVDTEFHIFRIVVHQADEHFAGVHVHFFIDDLRNEVDNSPITTNMPDDAGDFLQPYLYIITLEDAAKSMDVDYVAVRQVR